jgi:hypothetical protein
MRYSGAVAEQPAFSLPLRRAAAAVLVALCGLLSGSPAGAVGIAEISQRTYWGEPGASVFEHFGRGAAVLRQPIDFGDSYAQIVLRHVEVGGVPLVAFFQMDKTTGGLKRIQFERQRHGVNPTAFRAVVGGLEAEFGAPALACDIAPRPTGGYQAAVELAWYRAGDIIRAIFRDTTIEAFEGCLTGDLTLGPCGLTGQLLVRISPSESDRTACVAPPGKR